MTTNNKTQAVTTVKSRIPEGAVAKKMPTLAELVEQSAKELARALPDHMKPERIVRIALTCIRTNPKLAECTPESFMGALFTAAQLGVEPIAGKAHILPFNNRKYINNRYETVKEAQFVLGYPGIVDLFYRHEKAMSLAWGVVKKNDDFDYAYGTNSFLTHKPALANRGESIAFYVVAELRGGTKVFFVMSKDEAMQHGRDHSKTFLTTEWKGGQKVPLDEPHFDPNSPWATDEDSMCLKTTLIQFAKTLPKSSELQRAIANDEVSRDYRSGMASVLDAPSTTDWSRDADPKKAIEAKAAPAGQGFPEDDGFGDQADKPAGSPAPRQVPGRDAEGFFDSGANGGAKK